jgi:ribonuclease BN (tRNA processing enzyme)
MKVFFLGTNGWYDSPMGNTLCILIETKKECIVLDAGSGFYKLDKYIKGDKKTYLFLSHFHLDHIIGLHALAKFRFKKGLKIFGPPGIKANLNSIIAQPYSVPIKDLKMHVEVKELRQKVRFPFDFKFYPLRHSSVCYGYRFLLENKIVSFATDTGICDNLYSLANNADVLFLESSYKVGQDDPSWPHLNPKTAASFAKECGVKNLVLVHFDASIYTNIKQRNLALKVARLIFPRTFIYADNKSIELI